MKGAVIVLSGLCAAVWAGAALGHHSFAQFAMDRATRIEGTVKDFQWTNPHCWVELDVPNKEGIAETWSVEGGAVGTLMRFGVTRKSLQPGDHATLVIHPLRNGDRGGALQGIIFADGRRIDMGGPGQQQSGGGAPAGATPP